MSAYVPGCDHDVFVSYAHVDDEPLDGVEFGWVTTFVRSLETRLRQKLGAKNLSIWMDHQDLRGHISLTTQIVEALRRTATILVVVSPGYLRSDWCREERQQFFRMLKERTDSGSRVFLIELDKIDRGLFPHELNDLVGYRFWTLDRLSRVPRTFGTPVPVPSDEEYYRQLNRVGFELAEELTRMAGAGAAAPAGGAHPKPHVYLAEVTDDLDLRRDAVKDYLKHLGYNVVPETWQRHDDLDAFQKSVDADLERCSVYVQLLSDVAGKRPFGQAYGYPRLQYERAVALKKPILQWRDLKLDLTGDINPDQRALLEGPTVRAETLERFKSAIVEAVTPPPPPPIPLLPETGRFVLVSADRPDRTRAEEVVRSPSWPKELGYVIPPESDDPAVVRQCLELGLNECDGVVVVYCESDAASVLSQLMQCRKVLAQRGSPLRLIGIYDGPPPTEARPALAVGLPNLRYLNCRKDTAELQNFLATLTTASS